MRSCVGCPKVSGCPSVAPPPLGRVLASTALLAIRNNPENLRCRAIADRTDTRGFPYLGAFSTSLTRAAASAYSSLISARPRLA